jgi:hypothetical protein
MEMNIKTITLIEDSKRTIADFNLCHDRGEFFKKMLAEKKALGEKIRQEKLRMGN